MDNNLNMKVRFHQMNNISMNDLIDWTIKNNLTSDDILITMVTVKYKSPETPAEIEYRKQWLNYERKKEEWERATYERLKEKYEGK